MSTRRRGQFLTADDPPLADFQADPKLEERLGWMAEFIVCRECGQKRASIAVLHLRSHDLDQKTYHARWPGAPMLSDKTRNFTRVAALKFSKKNPTLHRQRSADWRNDPQNAPKLKAQGQRATTRRRANPEPHRIYDRNWYLKKKIPRATDADLLAFQNDPYSVRYVICLEPGCGAKLRDIGCAHLSRIHSLTPEVYAERHPGMPIKALRKRGRPRGRLDPDTNRKLNIIAYCKFRELSKYQISRYWNNITKDMRMDAAKTTIESLFTDHAGAIAEKEAYLSGLPDSECDTLSGLSASHRRTVAEMAAKRKALRDEGEEARS